jgi:hypothetical protein
MARSLTTFSPGQSGNPHGRPPKSRALTDLLAKAGGRTLVGRDGVRLRRDEVLAELVWEAATLGTINMGDGKPRVLGPKEWIDIVKFIYGQIDGPPKQQVDINVLIRREAERLSEQFGLDADDLVREAEDIMREARV